MYALDADTGRAHWLSAGTSPQQWTAGYVSARRPAGDDFPALDSPALDFPALDFPALDFPALDFPALGDTDLLSGPAAPAALPGFRPRPPSVGTAGSHTSELVAVARTVTL